MLKNIYNYFMLNRVLVVGTETNSNKIMEKLKSFNKFYLLKDTPTTDEKEVHNLSKQAHHIIITTDYKMEKDQQYDVYENLYSIKHNTRTFDNFHLNNLDDMFKKYENKSKLHLLINNDSDIDLSKNELFNYRLSHHYCLYRVQIHEMKFTSVNFSVYDVLKNMN